MTETSTLQEKAAETIHRFKNKLNMEEARRVVHDGKEYVKAHPGTSMAISVAAGFLIGYAARTIADRRRRASV